MKYQTKQMVQAEIGRIFDEEGPYASVLVEKYGELALAVFDDLSIEIERLLFQVTELQAQLMSQHTYDEQDACIAGRFRWYGKCKIGAAWILWRNITLLDSNEVEKAIKICKVIYERHNTSQDTVEWQERIFWNMMEDKKLVRHGKGVIEWVAQAV